MSEEVRWAVGRGSDEEARKLGGDQSYFPYSTYCFISVLNFYYYLLWWKLTRTYFMLPRIIYNAPIILKMFYQNKTKYDNFFMILFSSFTSLPVISQNVSISDTQTKHFFNNA
jgi:hypothetical protein